MLQELSHSKSIQWVDNWTIREISLIKFIKHKCQVPPTCKRYMNYREKMKACENWISISNSPKSRWIKSMIKYLITFSEGGLLMIIWERNMYNREKNTNNWNRICKSQCPSLSQQGPSQPLVINKKGRCIWNNKNMILKCENNRWWMHCATTPCNTTWVSYSTSTGKKWRTWPLPNKVNTWKTRFSFTLKNGGGAKELTMKRIETSTYPLGNHKMSRMNLRS